MTVKIIWTTFVKKMDIRFHLKILTMLFEHLRDYSYETKK